MPATGIVHGHPEGFGVTRNRARPAEPYPADLRDANLTDTTGCPANTPVSMVSCAPADDPESLIAVAFPPSRPAVRPAEEVPPRPVEGPQGLPLGDGRSGGEPQLGRPRFGELPALLRETGGRAASWPVRG